MTTLKYTYIVDVQDMFFFSLSDKCIAVANTFVLKPCGWNYFRSFDVIQIKPGAPDDLPG